MAEEFQGGVCGGNWAWTSSRNLFGSSPCSLASNDVFVWPNHDDDVTRLMEMKDTRSSDDSDGGGSVVIQKPAADGGMSVAEMMGDWNQDLLNDSGGSHQNYSSFHLMNPNMNYQHQHQHQTKVDDHHHQDFPQINSIQPNFPPLNTFSSSYNSLLQTLFDTDSDQPQEMNNYANYQPGFLPNFHKTTSPTVNQLAPAWSAAAAARSTFLPSTQSHYLPPSALTNKRPNLPSFGDNKHHHEQVKESTSVTKKSGSEPGYKRPRIETPSPLPTFKVRKEKLGDRITALQQLVSPFGKTDTASVLHEAIEYIKFLHDQVNALSTPYLKYGSPPLQRQQVDKSRDEQGLIKDLNSRGLCLVPISSTFPVAAETPSDFWTPTFGGNLK